LHEKKISKIINSIDRKTIFKHCQTNSSAFPRVMESETVGVIVPENTPNLDFSKEGSKEEDLKYNEVGR
jgi:hypothetical protein